MLLSDIAIVAGLAAVVALAALYLVSDSGNRSGRHHDPDRSGRG